jgi:hypothetical protein
MIQVSDYWPVPIRLPTLLSKTSLLIGISGVWNGFFMTASEYMSYTFWRMVSAVFSPSEVTKTNLVPGKLIEMYGMKCVSGLTSGR